jgi:hypothetical protein
MPELSDEDFPQVYTWNRALSKIMGEDWVGEVDGICFDLRHEQINPHEWRMEYLLGGDDGRPHRRITGLPFIWFSWYGEFDAN